MCVMKVVALTSRMAVPAPATTMVELTTAGPVGIATGVVWVRVGSVAVIGAFGSVVTSSDQAFRLPPSPARSSEMVRVQVPFGSSPMNAPMASSGTSGVAVVRLT